MSSIITSSIELKPCPFCGSEAKVQKDIRWPHYSRYGVNGYEIVCTNFDCIIYHADNQWYLTEEDAIDAWNSRYEKTCEMYRDESGTWHCTSCENGGDNITGSDGELNMWYDSWHPNFCPHCGCKVIV